MVNNTPVNNGYDENEPRWGKVSSGAQTERERENGNGAKGDKTLTS
jgi:hypothetical protein